MSYVSRIKTNFVLKFSNFRCHGNKGRSLVNFNEAVKLRHFEPLYMMQDFGNNSTARCYARARLCD